jgi:diguanylate cyclase
MIAQHTDEHRISLAMTWIAALLALLVAILIPAGYYVLHKRAMQHEMNVAAVLHATSIAQKVTDSEGDWHVMTKGLIHRPLTSLNAGERRTVLSLDGAILDQHGTAKPTTELLLRASADIVGRNGKLGSISITRTLNRIILDTVTTGLLASCIGLAMFISLRVLPLNALRRTTEKLKQTEGLARQTAENNFRLVFSSTLDSILIVQPDGEITTLNESAARLLQSEPAKMSGLNVRNFIDLEENYKTSGEITAGYFETTAHCTKGLSIAVEVTISESKHSTGSQRIIILRDITERQSAQLRLLRLANYDSLTGLPNRGRFREFLQAVVERRHDITRQGNINALMFLDLDRFKNINDTLGHAIGDQLLMQVADKISLSLRQTDHLNRNAIDHEELGVFRLGGDEFTVVLEGLPSLDAIETIAQRINQTIAQPFYVRGHQLYISASIGIAVYGADEVTIDNLVKQADLAMYRSKSLGKDTYTFYSEELQENIAHQHSTETALRQALERNEFRLVYQPKADIKSGAITGAEALLRWHRADGTIQAPDTFIGALEETGLIIPVGAWVIHEACATAMQWEQRGFKALTIAVNLSARQFRQKDLVEMIAQSLNLTGLPAQRLEIELTESTLIEDTQAVLEIMQKLGELGVKVAIDDFGTGHSSLRYLKRFAVDTLKIDRSFIRDIPEDIEDMRIASAVISLARSMNIKVVAEGVETEAQLGFLRAHGCDEIQGYLLSKPLPNYHFMEWLGTTPSIHLPEPHDPAMATL